MFPRLISWKFFFARYAIFSSALFDEQNSISCLHEAFRQMMSWAWVANFFFFYFFFLLNKKFIISRFSHSWCATKSHTSTHFPCFNYDAEQCYELGGSSFCSGKLINFDSSLAVTHSQQCATAALKDAGCRYSRAPSNEGLGRKQREICNLSD